MVCNHSRGFGVCLLMKLQYRRLLSADLTALLVVSIWGANFVFAKAALSEFNVAAFTGLRYLGMLILGWGVVALRPRAAAELASFSRADRRQVLLAGILGFTLYIPLSMVGLSFTTAFANALLIAVAPLFMAVLLWLRKMEAIRPAHMVGLGVSLAGTAVFISATAGGSWLSLGVGDLVSLLAAFFYAAYNVANKPLVARHPATVVTTVTLSAGAVPVVLVCLPGLLGQDWHRVTLMGWSSLGFSAVFPVYFAWTAWGWANSRLGVARTSLHMYLVPLVGGVTSWVVLRESFGPGKVAGAAIILTGLAVTRLLSARRSRRLEGGGPLLEEGGDALPKIVAAERALHQGQGVGDGLLQGGVKVAVDLRLDRG